MKKLLIFSLFISGSIIASGCATQATSQSMTVSPAIVTTKTNPKLQGRVVVGEVKGGKDTNPLWVSQVSNEEFKKALEQSLALSGYLAKSGNGVYTLTAELISLDQPLIGITFDVTSMVNYQLKVEDTTKTIPIKAIGSATFSDSWVGIERMRLANEKSIQKNIQELIIAFEKY